jgi:hypothetical protein
MKSFTAEIEKFDKMGEKTGWRYVFIPSDIAHLLKPNFKKSYRIKGEIDALQIRGLAIIPMGEGNFILPLNAHIRKLLKKEEGATVVLHIEEDTAFKIEMPEDLEMCLLDEPHLMENFLKNAKSHQNYFIKWIDSAKTEPTRAKRIALTVDAMDRQLDYGQMIRESKGKN